MHVAKQIEGFIKALHELYNYFTCELLLPITLILRYTFFAQFPPLKLGRVVIA